MHKIPTIILASGSDTRCQMLHAAGIRVTQIKPSIDEQNIKAALLAEAASPRDIADSLAEYKARKVSAKHPDALVIGCDQILTIEGTLLSKAKTIDEGQAQLKLLRGKIHQLISACVIYEAAKPVWRYVSTTKLTMRMMSDSYLDDYIARNWSEIRHCVGCYQIEAEGVRLFSRIDGDYFTVLGMPLLDVLSYLSMRGIIEG